MKVFVTGATGFTGSRVVPLLLQSEYQVRCLYRPTSDRSLLPQPEIEWASGNLSDTPALTASMQGTDALVNIASLGFGHAELIVSAAKKSGIERAIFISTTAIFTQLNANSKKVRVAAELAIENSGLKYTILRPTMIYGSPRDRNMWRLIRLIRYCPVVPVFGDGNSLQQPVYVDDVAQAAANSLLRDKTICKNYNISGKHPLTYNDVIDTIARQMNKRIGKFHVSSQLVVSMLRLFERIRLPFPIKSEQVLRLNEDKAFSYADAERDFDYNPLSFEDGIKLALEHLRGH
jgi:nucleoside-diphosphate-sugar epimerase